MSEGCRLYPLRHPDPRALPQDPVHLRVSRLRSSPRGAHEYGHPPRHLPPATTRPWSKSTISPTAMLSAVTRAGRFANSNGVTRTPRWLAAGRPRPSLGRLSTWPAEAPGTRCPSPRNPCACLWRFISRLGFAKPAIGVLRREHPPVSHASHRQRGQRICTRQDAVGQVDRARWRPDPLQTRKRREEGVRQYVATLDSPR